MHVSKISVFGTGYMGSYDNELSDGQHFGVSTGEGLLGILIFACDMYAII